jgi:cytochrome c biogenesis protein CcdA
MTIITLMEKKKIFPLALIGFLVCMTLLTSSVITVTGKEVNGCCQNGQDISNIEWDISIPPSPLGGFTFESENRICIIFFYDPTCRECLHAKEEMDTLIVKYPLDVQIYETAMDWNLLLRYYKSFNVSQKDYDTFAIFMGDSYYHKINHFVLLESKIKNLIESGLPCPELPSEENNESLLKGVTIITIITGGLIDGINPCAFATLIFFIAYLERVKQKKKTLLYIGISFSLAVFIGYILVGLGILEFYYQAEQSLFISDMIYFVAGAFALILGSFNLYDYVRVKKDEKPILQLPRFLKSKRGRIIRVLTQDRGIPFLVILAFLVGFGIALLEFVCTGQVLIPVLAVIKTASPERFTAYIYLIFYNIMFIVPLLLILGFFYFGYKSETFGEILHSRQGLIKILTAAFLFIIGMYMLMIVI